MLRQALLGTSRSQRIKNAITRAPVARDVVSRFVAGESADDAIAVTGRLAEAGLQVSLDHLGEDTRDPSQAKAIVSAYLHVLERLGHAGLTSTTELSVKLSALGQQLVDGDELAMRNAEIICRAADAAGTTVTIDMEDHTTTESTLATVRELRREFPTTGAVLQAYLYRTESDCRDLAGPGSRVRLCKGAYAEPASVAFQDRQEVDLSYVRCLKILMAGEGYPMLATHDPRLIAITQRLAADNGRTPDSYEFQMLYGIRPSEQSRLAGLGHRVRVYLPYGTDWYGYLIRRLAERPANLTFFARSLITKN
jgi:proline dehydrogenase